MKLLCQPLLHIFAFLLIFRITPTYAAEPEPTPYTVVEDQAAFPS